MTKKVFLSAEKVELANTDTLEFTKFNAPEDGLRDILTSNLDDLGIAYTEENLGEFLITLDENHVTVTKSGYTLKQETITKEVFHLFVNLITQQDVIGDYSTFSVHSTLDALELRRNGNPVYKVTDDAEMNHAGVMAGLSRCSTNSPFTQMELSNVETVLTPNSIKVCARNSGYVEHYNLDETSAQMVHRIITTLVTEWIGTFDNE